MQLLHLLSLAALTSAIALPNANHLLPPSYMRVFRAVTASATYYLEVRGDYDGYHLSEDLSAGWEILTVSRDDALTHYSVQVFSPVMISLTWTLVRTDCQHKQLVLDNSAHKGELLYFQYKFPKDGETGLFKTDDNFGSPAVCSKSQTKEAEPERRIWFLVGALNDALVKEGWSCEDARLEAFWTPYVAHTIAA